MARPNAKQVFLRRLLAPNPREECPQARHRAGQGFDGRWVALNQRADLIDHDAGLEREAFSGVQRDPMFRNPAGIVS